MNTKADREPNLQIIPGTYPLEISFGTIHIVAAPKDRPPFKADAMAFEEDTFLVMSAEPLSVPPRNPS